MVKNEAPKEFNPLDMRNYTLEKLPVLPSGKIQQFLKDIGIFLALAFFLFWHFKLTGKIEIFEEQTAIAPGKIYTMLGIFGASVILWITEAIPNYLTSLILIISVVLFKILPEKKAYAYFGHRVMILNIASFILANMLVVSGAMERIVLKFIVLFGKKATYIFYFFLIFNLILGAFINATAAKAALLMPIFMVISAIYGARGGDNRNNFARNLVLQNLLGINVSCSAYMTGSAANLVAASMIVGMGVELYYMDWFVALAPLAFIVLVVGWFLGTKVYFRIPKEMQEPQIEGGIEYLKNEAKKFGPIKMKEIKSAIIFLFVLIMWATDKLHGISATAVALIGAAIALLPNISKIPKVGVITWNDTDIPWHLLLFSFGAYVLGGGLKATNAIGLIINNFFDSIGDNSFLTTKLVIFLITSGFFLFSSILTQSKTARTLIFFPIILEIARRFNYDILGFALPMAFLINQVYVLYFNSKPATICYLSNHYSNGESFKYGFTMLFLVWGLIVLWAQYYLPLLGYSSKLW